MNEQVDFLPTMTVNDEDREIIIRAIEAARHQPRLIDGTWWMWDFETRQYIDSRQTGSFEDSAPLNGTIKDIKDRLSTLESLSGRSSVAECLTQSDYDSRLLSGNIENNKIYFTFSKGDDGVNLLLKGYIGREIFASRLMSGKSAPVSLPEGVEFGSYESGVSGGSIDSAGNGELESLHVRGPFITNEIIFNNILAQNSDSYYTDNGMVESVGVFDDGTYALTLSKRYDNDYLQFKEGDILYGEINDIIHSEGAFISWMRVLSVDYVKNRVNVVLYKGEDVPGGQNHSPISNMKLVRRGNAIDEDRQSYWYLSSTSEKCFVWLEGVDKPILDEDNYYIIIGRPKKLSIFDNLPINYRQSYIYARGGIFQDLFRVDFGGSPVQELVDRGYWSSEVASSESPYLCTDTIAHTVWHYGCRWKCLRTGTLDEPMYSSPDWAMLEGNPQFSISIESSEGWLFNVKAFKTTLSVRGMIYNRDITESIQDDDVTWTRDTGNKQEDEAWAISRKYAGKTLPLTVEDLGPDYTSLQSCKFKCVAMLRDGQTAEDYITI